MNIIPPRILCLSGGGIRTVAFVGALEVLAKHKLLAHVTEYVGVSAGALIAFVLSVGYTVQELKKLVVELDFGVVRNLEPENTLEFLERYGLDNGANLVRLLEAVMRQKNLSPTTTFQDLSKIRPPLPAFRCYATDLEICQPREFSLAATPHVKITEALRASMSLPFYFTPVQDPLTGHTLTDGGVMNNYPMVFLSEIEQKHALGLLFSTAHAENKTIESLYDYILQMFACVYLPRTRQIQRNLGGQSIFLPHGDFPSWNFEATKEERGNLIEAAAAATESFLKSGNRTKPYRRYSVA